VPADTALAARRPAAAYGVRPRRDRPRRTRRLRAKLSYTNIGFALAPPTFTISELREIYAAALGHEVSATNLQRVLVRRELLEDTGERRPPGPHAADLPRSSASAPAHARRDRSVRRGSVRPATRRSSRLIRQSNQREEFALAVGPRIFAFNSPRTSAPTDRPPRVFARQRGFCSPGRTVRPGVRRAACNGSLQSVCAGERRQSACCGRPPNAVGRRLPVPRRAAKPASLEATPSSERHDRLVPSLRRKSVAPIVGSANCPQTQGRGCRCARYRRRRPTAGRARLEHGRCRASKPTIGWQRRNQGAPERPPSDGRRAKTRLSANTLGVDPWAPSVRGELKQDRARLQARTLLADSTDE